MADDPQPKGTVVPFALARRRKGYCEHIPVYVVEETRMLECRSCGAMVDPFDYMWKWACKGTRLTDGIKHLEGELRRMNAELEDLKRQRANLKAQIRRAG